MDADQLDDLFGRIAFEKEYITDAELKDALEAKRHLGELGITDKTLADILLQKGYISDFEKEEITSQLEEAATSGTTVHGYQVLLELEHDGPGKLYKAYQPAMDRTVLLRVLSKKDPAEAEQIPKLKREAKLLARLQHPSVVAGYDAGETDEEYFLVSEYVDGIKLSQLIELESPLGEEETLKTGLRIARALEYLDEQEIVHRDVEPENIVVTKTGEAKIANLAHAVSRENVASFAGENIQAATPFYMAPEQAKGFTDLDGRTDLFSLGATLYHMLTGQYPYGSDSEMVLAHIITKEVPDPRTIAPDVSRPIAELISKMMQKEQEDRYQSAVEVRMRIEEILAAGVKAEPEKARPKKSSRSRRQRVKQASRMFQAQAATPKPATPFPVQAAAAPPVTSYTSVPSADTAAAKPKPEPVRPRSAAVATAKAGSPYTTTIFGIIGIVVAVVIIIIVAVALSSKSSDTDTSHDDAGARKPRPAPPEPRGPTVAEIAAQEAFEKEKEQLAKIREFERKSPGSFEVVDKYDEFLKNAKDARTKDAALEARSMALSALYSAANKNAEKLREQHNYSEAVTVYQRLLGFIPASEKDPRRTAMRLIERTREESENYYTQESSKAESLFDLGKIDDAVAIYERLKRNCAREQAEIAKRVLARYATDRPKVDPREEDIPPGPGPEEKTPEEIEAELKKKEAEEKLQAMKQRLVAQLQTQVGEHVRGMRIIMAKQVVAKALRETKDPGLLAAAKQVEKHLQLIEKATAALKVYMDKLYKKPIVELWLKKRRRLLGELTKYEFGVIIFKERDGDIVQVRLSELLESEVERALLDGFGSKNAETYLSMAVFFVYYYGDCEITGKYLNLAQAAGADVKQYVQILRGAGFETALASAEDDMEKQKFFSAYMKLTRLRADYARSEVFKQRKDQVDKLIDKAFDSSGLGKVFVGKLSYEPSLFEISYDFAHSSQLNDFDAATWSAKGGQPEEGTWRLEDDTLAGGGAGVMVWHGRAKDEVSVSFFAELRQAGPFEVFLFADPEKPYSNRAYVFGFNTIVNPNDKDAEPEHYIALWDGKKKDYKYLKRGLMKPMFEEEKTYLIQVLYRHGTLQMFINDKKIGEVEGKESGLDSGTVVLRVNESLVRFDNLKIKAKLDDGWLRKTAKDAK